MFHHWEATVISWSIYWQMGSSRRIDSLWSRSWLMEKPLSVLSVRMDSLNCFTHTLRQLGPFFVWLATCIMVKRSSFRLIGRRRVQRGGLNASPPGTFHVGLM